MTSSPHPFVVRITAPRDTLCLDFVREDVKKGMLLLIPSPMLPIDNDSP